MVDNVERVMTATLYLSETSVRIDLHTSPPLHPDNTQFRISRVSTSYDTNQWNIFHRYVTPSLRGSEMEVTDWLYSTAEHVIRQIDKKQNQKSRLIATISQPTVLLSLRKRGFMFDDFHQIKTRDVRVESERARALLSELKDGHHLSSPWFREIDPIKEGCSRFILVYERFFRRDPVIVDKQSPQYTASDFLIRPDGKITSKSSISDTKYSELDICHSSVLRLLLYKDLN